MERIDGQHVLILGLSSSQVKDAKVLLSKLRYSFPRVKIQLMRADRIAGTEHLTLASANALRAFSQGQARSRSLEMEILLYASCKRQISKAIEMLGLTPLTREIAVVALSESPTILSTLPSSLESMISGQLDPSVLEVRTKQKLSGLRRVFDITKRELQATLLPNEKEEEAVKRLVIERSALLALES